jgi:hypothetical protein
MPEYYLCPKCTQIPVTRPGELCSDCQRQQKESDRRTKEQLDRLEKKPRRLADVK